MADRFLDLFGVHLQLAAAVLLLWAVVHITDQSLISTIKEIVKELSALGRISPKGINVLGGILWFALAVFLFFAGLGHIALPNAHNAHGTTDITRAISVGVLFLFGLYFIVCIAVTKRYK